MIDPHYHKFIGQELIKVEAEIQKDLPKGMHLSVMDKTFPQNIDVDPKRLNVFVNDQFIITKIWVG